MGHLIYLHKIRNFHSKLTWTGLTFYDLKEVEKHQIHKHIKTAPNKNLPIGTILLRMWYVINI